MDGIKLRAWRGILLLACRIGLGLMYLSSGVGKLTHLQDFARAVESYHVLGATGSHFFADVLPWVELLVGAYLLIGLFTRFAAGLSGVMLLSFVIAISLALLRGETPDCGCYIGGEQSEPISWMLVWRDVLFLALSACLARWPDTPVAVDAQLKLPGV